MKSPTDLSLTVIMATMRSQNWPLIFATLKEISATPGLKLYWLPVLYPRERLAADPTHENLLFGYDAPRWVQPLVIAEEPYVAHCNRKQNAALEALESRNYHGYVITASDDNLLPRNVGKRLIQAVREFQSHAQKNTGAAPLPIAVVFSHARGQHIPETTDASFKFPTWDLIAAPPNMAIGKVSGEQCFVHSRALHQWRYPHHGCSDGMLAEALVAARPDLIAYVPDYFTPFNALEPGRWEADALQKVLVAE